jgi:hypothetical protein
MKVLEAPQVVTDDPVVHQIRLRAKAVRKQLDKERDPFKKARLQGQFDAYMVDLQDAARAAIGKAAFRVEYAVNSTAMEALIQAS